MSETLEDCVLMYEEVYPKYKCEHEGCDARATVEWVCREELGDNEGSLYYTMRCDSHGVSDPQYKVEELA